MQIKTEKEVISGIYDKNYSLFDLPCERLYIVFRRRRYRDRMVVWFTNTGAIKLWVRTHFMVRCMLDATLYDNVCNSDLR